MVSNSTVTIGGHKRCSSRYAMFLICNALLLDQVTQEPSEILDRNKSPYSSKFVGHKHCDSGYNKFDLLITLLNTNTEVSEV